MPVGSECSVKSLRLDSSSRLQWVTGRDRLSWCLNAGRTSGLSSPADNLGCRSAPASRPFLTGDYFSFFFFFSAVHLGRGKQHRPDGCLFEVWNDLSHSAGLDWHCLLICYCGLLRITRLLANSRLPYRGFRRNSDRVGSSKTENKAGKKAAPAESAPQNGFGRPLRGRIEARPRDALYNIDE